MTSRKPRRPWDPAKTPKAVARYQALRSIRKVATELGWSYSTIRDVLLEAGVELGPRGGSRVGRR
jgi:predicted transcriptional regulator